MYIYITRKLAFLYWRFPRCTAVPDAQSFASTRGGMPAPETWKCTGIFLYTYTCMYIFTRASLRRTPQQQVDCLLT